MGAQESQLSENYPKPVTFSAGNFMQKDVQKWEEAQQNQIAIGACACAEKDENSSGKLSKSKSTPNFMSLEVQSWKDKQNPKKDDDEKVEDSNSAE